MEGSNQNYDLFLQEIEGVDDYWGSTFRWVSIIMEIWDHDKLNKSFIIFRAIYECEDHTTFMEHLEKRIKYHDKEIERMCNNYYQGFIDSIRDLQQVRTQAKTLNVSILF